MTLVDFAPASGKVYKKLPLTKKEQQKLLTRYKEAPLFRKKAEAEGKRKTVEAEKMLGSLFAEKKPLSKSTLPL